MSLGEQRLADQEMELAEWTEVGGGWILLSFVGC